MLHLNTYSQIQNTCTNIPNYTEIDTNTHRYSHECVFACDLINKSNVREAPSSTIPDS